MNKQREIKFRVWDKKTKKYALYDGIFNNKGQHLTFGSVFDYPKEHNIVIQQFTGLKDSKGKEIYEGDIVKVGGESIIQMNRDTFEVCYHAPHFEPFNNYEARNCEIIGNIYENPNLIK